jgi:glycosyltransferase involved in cell wall biosynthesis
LSFIYDGFRLALPFGIKSAIEKEMARFKPEVIHIQDHFVISPIVQKIAKTQGIPIMGTNHFMPENLLHYLHLPKKLEQVVKNWAWGQFRKIFEELHAVTTPTKTAAGLLKDVNLTKPVVPISNGIDLQKFHPNNDGNYLKQRYDLPNKPVLLYVGRLDKEKNIDLILRAMPKILKSVDMHFLIAGKGVEMANLQKLARNLNLTRAVTFTGFVPDEDLHNIYKIADCFIIAGIAELQSLVTMEAMASGLPVIAVNAMALPELVHDGENGYLFPEGNSQTLSEQVVKILSNPELKNQMSQKSLEIIKNHDIQKTISAYESIYHHILEKMQKNDILEKNI